MKKIIKYLISIISIIIIICLSISICKNAYRAKDYTCRTYATLIYDYSEEGELPYKYVYGFAVGDTYTEFNLTSYRRLGTRIPIFYKEGDTSIVYIEYNKYGFKKLSSYVRKLF